MPIANVQSATQTNTGATSGSFNITLGANPTNGSLLVVTFGAWGGIVNSDAVSIASVTSSGAIWQSIARGHLAPSATVIGCDAEIWAAPNVHGASAATVTVNLNSTGNSGQGVVASASEFSHVRIESNFFDQIKTATGTGATATDGGASTNTGVAELSVGCIGTSAVTAGTWPNDAGATQLYNTQFNATTGIMAAAYRIFDTSTTADPGNSATGLLSTTNWAGCRVSFFVAHGPGPEIVIVGVKRANFY